MPLAKLTRRKFLQLALAAGAVLLAIVLRPFVHLFDVSRREKRLTPYAPPDGLTYFDDASRMNRTRIHEFRHVPVESARLEEELAVVLRSARAQKLPVSQAGRCHSMGGHVMSPDGVVLDLTPYRPMNLDAATNTLRVGAGAPWQAVLRYLDERGLSVAIMQSNNDFTVGGAISVNAHGWQTGRAPIASSVRAFRLMDAAGDIRACSRVENRELFGAALGGYGLFGVILDVDLEVVPNESYVFRRFHVPAKDYAATFAREVAANPEARMAYGRLCVDTRDFLADSILTVFEPSGRSPERLLENRDPKLESIARLIFRGSTGSEYGKRLRWDAETGKYLDLADHEPISRNVILDEPVAVYQERAGSHTDILHEYFVPRPRLEEFLAAIRPLVERHGADLLNVTIRDLQPDADTLLRYAREECFAIVMLFNHERTPQADLKMRDFTREVIDAALEAGGTYYLPYRPHATREQFQRGYPQAAEFFALKKKYDPDGLFRNGFLTNYG